MTTERSLMAVIRASRPSFRNPHDRVAFAVHAAFVAAGYILHETGPSAFADDVFSSSAAGPEEVGIDNWNAFDDNYAFVYSNPDKGSKKVLVKCLAINNHLMVDVLKEGDSELLHIEIDGKEYVEDNGGTSYVSQYKNLKNLVADFNKEILVKLDGSLATSSSTQHSSSETNTRDDRSRPMTGVDDPEDPPPIGYIVPPIPGSGHGDLFPGPGAGIYPTRGDFGGGSMLVGPNDARFFGGMTREPGIPGSLQGIPPGARFDPYGPPGIPGFEPSRFVRIPRRPPGGTHPDLQHFPDGSDYI